MDKITLSELTKKIIERMKKQGYSKTSIKKYERLYTSFIKYSKSHNVDIFDENIANNFLKEKFNSHTYNKKIKNLSYKIRPIIILKEFVETGTYKETHQHEKYHLPQTFELMFNNYHEYQKSLNLKNSTIRSQMISIKMFLIYLDKGKTLDIKTMSSNDVYKYINSLHYASQTITGITYTLRKFFNYLYDNSLINISGNALFPIIKKHRHDKILSYYSKEEIVKILSVIDNTTKTGKRDYLIISLAVYLGIRQSDIINLKFDNINFNIKTIEFIQIKTNTTIQLPLLDNIKYTLLDYLKNARPNIDSPYIIIMNHVPYTKYNSGFERVLTRYMDLANINYKNKKHGLHSMRHSLASNMLGNNTPMPVITGILGHTSINTTNMYLQIDINSLRKLSLEVTL